MHMRMRRDARSSGATPHTRDNEESAASGILLINDDKNIVFSVCDHDSENAWIDCNRIKQKSLWA